MSATTSTIVRRVNGVPTNADSASIILSRDNDNVVLVNNAVPSNPSVGIYSYDHGALNLDPAYNYTIKWTFLTAGYDPDIQYTAIVAGADGREPRATIRRRIARLVLGRNRFAFGPVTAASTSYVETKFAKRFPNGHFKGRSLYVVSGTGLGQERVITDHTQGDGRLLVNPSFDVTPDISSIVEIYADNITVDEINDAINLAILDCSRVVHARVEETLLPAALDATRKQLTLPANFSKLYAIKTYAPNTGWKLYAHEQDVSPTLTNTYKVIGHVCYFPEPIPSDATTFLACGYRRPNRLLSDSELCDVEPSVITLLASYYLEAADAEGGALDPEEHAGRAGNWYRQGMLLRAESQSPWWPNTVDLIL